MPEPSMEKRLSSKERFRDYDYGSRSRSNWSPGPGSPPSPKRYKTMRKRYSYSRSRSPSPDYRSLRRRTPPSRSPYRRSYGNNVSRENPQQSRCIGIFGLNISTSDRHIREIFEKFGPIERIQLVIDAKTGRSRGFCFVYFSNLLDAKSAKEHCSGMEIGGRRIRVDYSITSKAHAPTPGMYMGKYQREERSSYQQSNRRRTPPSPPHRERRRRYRSRSRSRSYSPRRY